MSAPHANRVCAWTGLIIVNQPERVWRAFKQHYGPLNPKLKQPGDSDGRFNCTGHVTVYAASGRRGAFEEALAYLNPADQSYLRIFPEIDPDEDPVADEWKQAGNYPSKLDILDWAEKFRVAELAPAPGNYVQVLAAGTIGALRSKASDWMPVGYTELDVSALTSGKRELTCAAANWVSQQVLDDGSVPAGVEYLSKHGTDHECWAIWVPLLGAAGQAEVPSLVAARVELITETAIEPDDEDLRWAVDALGWPAA